MDEIDFSDIEAKYAVTVPTTFDNVVLIDNVPVVDSSKEEKLMGVIRKLFKSVGTIDDKGIFMPKGEDGKSKGFMFVRFITADSAKAAIAQFDGYRFDKAHTFALTAFDAIDNYSNIDVDYVEPVLEEFQPKEHLKYWLGDKRARDQFALIKGNEVGIYWNNKSELPDKIELRQNWSELFIAWSPQGSYFVTTYRQGIALWGGPSWQKINRFAHPNVQKLEFSPNEKYVVTWSQAPFQTVDGQAHNLCVWNVQTGLLMRSFPTDPVEDESTMEWPILKWSHDDQYVARMKAGAQGSIFVYESATMLLLDKKSIKVENLLGFEWSPSDNYISYWTPELGNIPARVTLINIPSRAIIRTKNFFNILNCKLFWQHSGDYLLVKLERTKTKTTTITSFEVFRIREKDIPVDVVELKVSEEINALFWEPKGNRFALLLSLENNNYIQFYEVEKSTKSSSAAVKMQKQLDAKNFNKVSWSPNGRFCVLAGGKGMSGDLQFFDAQELTILGTGEHYGSNEIEWDPTGRYVATSATSWKPQSDTGLMLWTMSGQELSKQNINGLKQFAWRPRPKTLLSAEAQKNIKKNLKEYSKGFDEEDARESNKANTEIQDKKRQAWAEYKQMMEEFALLSEQETPERVAIYGFDPMAEEVQEMEEYVEIITEETEEVEL